MSNKEMKVSVVTLPLKTEPWQADRLGRIMESCRSIYNSMLGILLKRYRRMRNDPRYRRCNDIIRACYESGDMKSRKSDEYRAAVDERNRIFKEYGFTEFDFTNLGTEIYGHYKENVSSMMKNRSVAKPLWNAFSDFFYKNGKQVHFKKKDEWNSVSTDGKSGLRLVNRDNKTLLTGTAAEPMWLYVGTRSGKSMQIPVILPEKDEWKREMVCRPIRVVRVIRKKVRGTDKYYLQLTVEGGSAPKLDRQGVEKHPIGQGKVGVYIDSGSVTIATQTETRTFPLNTGNEDLEKEKAELMRFLEASRRASNPENFYPSGAIRRRSRQQGKKAARTWNYSNHYKAARAKLADLYRVEAENRRLERTRIANEILGYGNEFTINAPGLLTQLLKQKAEDGGKGSVRVVSLEETDKTGDYRERFARKLMEACAKM